jgi:DNA-directed RNA polymerase specialized sigma24 family protein
VYSYARYLLRHSEDAQDVAQECLLRLWNHRERVERGAACRNWLLARLTISASTPIEDVGSRAEVDRDENAPEPADVRPDAFRIASASQGRECSSERCSSSAAGSCDRASA